MEKEDLKGKRNMEDVYETQVEANNHQYQHEDAMMTMERNCCKSRSTLNSFHQDVPGVQYLWEFPPSFMSSPSDQELLWLYLKTKIDNPDLKFVAMPFIPYSITKRYANGKRPTRTMEGHRHWRMTIKTLPITKGNTEKSITKTNWLIKEYHIPGSELTLCRIYLNK
ncbi:hypothetical protein MKX03_016514 [Papaver bracteatum]|nr:hypothetical protein MKX03_016514 [Papaver bracteatum]